MAASPLAPASPFTSAGMSREWKTIMEAALGPTWERMVNDTTIRPLFNEAILEKTVPEGRASCGALKLPHHSYVGVIPGISESLKKDRTLRDPRGHALKLFQRYRLRGEGYQNGYRCEICGAGGGDPMHCSECKYDLCPACAKNQSSGQ